MELFALPLFFVDPGRLLLLGTNRLCEFVRPASFGICSTMSVLTLTVVGGFCGGSLLRGSDASFLRSFDFEVVKLGRFWEASPTLWARISRVCSLYFWKASDWCPYVVLLKGDFFWLAGVSGFSYSPGPSFATCKC